MRTRPGGRKRMPSREPKWVAWSDEELLATRFCDLRLSLQNSALLNRALEKLRIELERRDLTFRPHAWLAEEWFSPDGVPGIAIAFYLAHPRLVRLERRFMHEVEGGTATSLMRILRHETGHALDTAFRLRRRKDWREIFGHASRPYPAVYRPHPASHDFVLHLGHWYAQSHPTEDFAETFAVWLQPRARWRHVYSDWPALAKLEYVDNLMDELAGEPPLNTVRELIEPLHENTRTLRDHYQRKLAHYQLDVPDIYDSRLKRVFKHRKYKPDGRSAAAFLKEVHPHLTRRSRMHPYLVQQVLSSVIQRCHELDLVVVTSEREAKRAAWGVLERILMDVLRRGRQRYAL